MKKIIANTFTPLYDEVEDRIVLVINYEDIHNRVDLMITRSFILKLLPVADEFLAQHYLDQYTQNHGTNPADTIEKTQQTGLSQTNSENLEFFSQEKELLLELNFAFIADRGLTNLTFSSKKSFVSASLDYTLLQQLIQTIKTAIPNFAWGIAINF